jgi:hypothetical protein
MHFRSGNNTNSQNLPQRTERINSIDQLDLLQLKVSQEKKPEMPLYLRRNVGLRVSTEKNTRAQIKDERSPSKTEEYWAHYNQVSPKSSIFGNLNSEIHLDKSRSSSRLSAANEILFGNSRSNNRHMFTQDNSPALDSGNGLERMRLLNERQL